MRLLRVRVKFEPRDLWVGIYWERPTVTPIGISTRRIFVCLVPCFPIVFTYHRNATEGEFRGR